MGFCISCEKCNFTYDTKYFPEFCPNCYIGSLDLKEEVEESQVKGALEKLHQKEKVFDVAKWSREDISCELKELEPELYKKVIEVCGEEGAIDSVIDNLEESFDGSVGVNWDTIKDAVLSLALDLD